MRKVFMGTIIVGLVFIFAIYMIGLKTEKESNARMAATTCKDLLDKYEPEFKKEQNDRKINIESFLPSKTFYNSLQYTCLLETGVVYSDHGGLSEDRFLINLSTKEKILKGSNAVAYINKGGVYYVDPIKAGVITDLNEFDRQAKALINQ